MEQTGDYQTVRDYVNDLRHPIKGRPVFEMQQDVARVILSDLRKRGKFYYNSSGCYYFNNEKKELIQLNLQSDDTKLCINNYDILANETIYKHVFNALEMESRRNGSEAEVYDFSYFNPRTLTIYIYNHNHQMYKITGDTIELVDNGTDGVLFLHSGAHEPFKKVDINPDVDYLDKYITSGISLQEDTLTIKDGKAIFTIWFYGLFFETIMPTKVIMAFVGEKGSSKTTTSRKVGLLFFGSKFNVTPVPSKADDFDTAVANNYYVVFDNVDGSIKWLNDKLASISTGQNIKKRKLYTDNIEVNIPTHCFVTLTSRTPHFRRDDVSDRLLIMRTKRLPDFRSEKDCIDEIGRNRNEIMTYVMYTLQRLLINMVGKEEKALVSFRMADFGKFALGTASILYAPEDVKVIFDKMSQEQSRFTLENEPIYEILNIWIDENGNQGREVTSAQLYDEFTVIAREHNISFYYRSPRGLAQRLTNIRSNLGIYFNISDRTGGRNVTWYKFERKPQKVE